MSSIYRLQYVFFLRAPHGRDQILMTLRDLSKMFTICISPKYSGRLDIFENQMLDCLSILKFCDLTALSSLLNIYKWKLKEEFDIYEAYCTFIQNVATICSQVTNHVIWAGRHNILPININTWILSEAYFSIASYSMEALIHLKRRKIIQSLIYKANKEINNAENRENFVSLVPKEEISSFKSFEAYHLKILKHWNYLSKENMLICAFSSLQTIYFINYLPKGVLWGGRLSTWQLGTIGVISSLIHIYQTTLYINNKMYISL